jgi:uncharacterized protein (TIGR02246 family)
MVQQAVRSAIEGTNAQFVEAANSGDTARVASLYTEDAVLLAPNAPMMRGRQEIKAFFDGMVAQMGLPKLQLNTKQVEEHGDTAWEVGAYTMKLQGVSDEGKYIVVWKRHGSDWKLAADIWNTDSPPPSA